MFDYLLTAIEQCASNVHPKTMSAVIYHESKGNPFAIGVNTKNIKLKEQPTTKEAAITAAKELLDAGANMPNRLLLKTIRQHSGQHCQATTPVISNVG